jgi:hypothetical protein
LSRSVSASVTSVGTHEHVAPHLDRPDLVVGQRGSQVAEGLLGVLAGVEFGEPAQHR